ncbi:MAG: type II toxin-antitoxin system VapC family toxin [Solirubrobacteraceae bacterium]
MTAVDVAPARPNVLDADVLIAHLNPDDAQHSRAVDRLERAAAQGPLAASALTVAEVLVHPTAGGLGEQAYAALKAMDLTVPEIPADAAVQLALFRARTGRRMPDCCVLLAAARTGGAVLTFDEKLRGSAADLGISIC